METNRKQIELDGQNLDFDSSLTFGNISEQIKTKLAPARVLTEIIVDGKAIDLGEEERLNQIFVGDMGNVVVKSRDVNELFKESLDLAPKICEALQLDCEDIEGFFDTKDLKMAQDRVGEMTSLLEWLLQLISGLQSLGNEQIESMHFTGGKVMETVNRMQFLLAKLHLHLAAQQWDEFRVILKGDFKNEVGVWHQLFSDVSTAWTPRAPIRDS